MKHSDNSAKPKKAEDKMGQAKKIVRRATFEVSKEQGVKRFTPVNKRARRLAREVGKRTRVTASDLRQMKANANGKTKFYQYTSNGAQRAIRV